MPSEFVSLMDIEDARKRLEGVAVPTPLDRSRSLSGHAGGDVFIKCENLQRTGSFKIRGAYNRISRLDDRRAEQGSGGCFGRQPRPGSRAGRDAQRDSVARCSCRKRRRCRRSRRQAIRSRGRADRQGLRRGVRRRGRAPRNRRAPFSCIPSTTHTSSPARERSGSRSSSRWTTSEPSSFRSAEGD